MAKSGRSLDEPEGIPRQDSVSSQQDLVQWDNASVETGTVMSWLGYGSEIIQARKDAYREYGRLWTALACGAGTCIITGSKAEGLTRYLKSDRDIMFVHSTVICIEDGVNADNFSREITVFRSYSRMSYPGHCRLLLERRGKTIHPNIKDALCDDWYGQELLSSDLYGHDCSKVPSAEGAMQHDRAGPSTPLTVSGILRGDVVHAFCYYSPSILSK
ncbi:uncharacterized protein LOC127869480 [Dreissena polymorpha]|nr:uncharacterized protein LOC127869480 [Dreissena polymorpha]